MTAGLMTINLRTPDSVSSVILKGRMIILKITFNEIQKYNENISVIK